MKNPWILASVRLVCAVLVCLAAQAIVAPGPADAGECCDPAHPCPVRLPCCVDTGGPDVDFLPVTGPSGRPAAPLLALPVAAPGPGAAAHDPDAPALCPGRASPDRAALCRPSRLGRFLL